IGSDETDWMLRTMSYALRRRTITEDFAAKARVDALVESGAPSTWRHRSPLSRIRVEDLRAFFDRYYYAGNMIVFLAGGFDGAKALAAVRETFGRFPANGGRLAPLQMKSKLSPYLRTELTHRMPSIRIGTQFDDISAEDEIALDIFASYLADRVHAEPELT